MKRPIANHLGFRPLYSICTLLVGACTLLVGVSLEFPLFLFFRERSSILRYTPEAL
jgi:hypothetical protein